MGNPPARRSCPQCTPQPNDFLRFVKVSSLNIAIGGIEKSSREYVYRCANCGYVDRFPDDDRGD